MDFSPFYNDLSCDLNIIVDGATVVRAHKIVLWAASKYFRDNIPADALEWVAEQPHREFVVVCGIRSIYGLDVHAGMSPFLWNGLLAFAQSHALNGLEAELNARKPSPVSFIQSGHGTRNPAMIREGINAVLDDTDPVARQASIDAFGKLSRSAYLAMREIWLEAHYDHFILLQIGCNVFKGTKWFNESVATMRDLMAESMMGINFSTFTREQCELAKGFPVICDWDFCKHLLSEIAPK
jgi:hypothetical protein